MNVQRTNAAICGGVSFLACVAVVYTAGQGASSLLAGVAAGLIAALAAFFVVPRAEATKQDGRLQDAIAANSQLRHDLRGALSPALLVSDRLTGHGDPAVVKAGNTVVRAVQRATELLESNKVADAGRKPAP